VKAVGPGDREFRLCAPFVARSECGFDRQVVEHRDGGRSSIRIDFEKVRDGAREKGRDGEANIV
jgi:hypothetical protein